MRFNAQWNPFQPNKTESWQQWATRLSTDIGRLLDSLSQLLNGQVTFGDGSDTDNVKGQWITFTSDAAAGTTTEVPHTLGVIPPGFILMIPPVSGVVNKGTTPWTTSTISLSCTEPSQSITIFVLAPPATE